MKNYSPYLILRTHVLTPGAVNSIFVARKSSIAAINFAFDNHCQIVVGFQQNAGSDAIERDKLHQVSTLATLQSVINIPDSNTKKVVLTGLERVKAVNVLHESSLWCSFEPFPWEDLEHKEFDATFQLLIETLDKVKIPDNHKPWDQVKEHLEGEASTILNQVISHFPLFDYAQRCALYNEPSALKAVMTILKRLTTAVLEKEIKRKISKRIQQEVAKSHKEIFLNEQIKAAQKELGSQGEFDVLLEKMQKAKLPKHAVKKCKEEIQRLQSMPSSSMEAAMLRTYVETLINLPWNKSSKVKHNLLKAKEVLDEDHHGISKVKDRILNFLAVQKRTGKMNGTILCLVGPPGVGKTSLGKSIAKATGRKYIRMALGGLNDEGEIRGHRKTYVGAMSGRIMKEIEKVNVNNPLFLLDEVDKVSSHWRGDPASALLEVLDPEQNHTFMDNYLETEFDLSNVLFICTANSLNIPAALRDRMEVIQLSGYSQNEKLLISQKHLVDKQIKANGLKASEISFDGEALAYIMEHYTSEAGIRSLERMIGKVCSSVVRTLEEHAITKTKVDLPIAINEEQIHKYLGAPNFKETERVQKPTIGRVNGLAWTEHGGKLLPIETTFVPNGSGKVVTTGSLGKVMKESIEIAASILRTRTEHVPVVEGFPKKLDLHLHMPSGAIPKDGPSAGVGICVAMFSALCQIPVNHEVAVTGEVSLLGQVLRIGGLKDKLLAAQVDGIKTALIPQGNLSDYEEIKDELDGSMKVVPINYIDEAWSYFFDESDQAVFDTQAFNEKQARKLSIVASSLAKPSESSVLTN